MLAKTHRIIVLFTQNLSLSYQNYGFEIWDSEKTYPDPGSKRHRSPDPDPQKKTIWWPPKTEVLLLPDLAADTVLRLLRFLYLGVLTIGRHHIGDFLDLVEQWGISPRVTILPMSAAAAEGGPATPALVGSC